MKPSWLNTLKMDSSISDSAKEIVCQRGPVSNKEIIPLELDTFDVRMQKLDSILVNLSELDYVNKRLDNIEQSLVHFSEMDPVNKRLDKFESILMNFLEISEKNKSDNNIELVNEENIQDLNNNENTT